MTILLYVRRKGWPLRRVTVECSHRRVHAEDGEDCETNDRACLDEIRRHILLEGDLTEEQRVRLAYIATRCPIHRTLERVPSILDEVEVAT
jgi:putative redox protein